MFDDYKRITGTALAPSHGDTRNAVISTPLVIESSPRAFWKARSFSQSVHIKIPGSTALNPLKLGAPN